jgi:ABC-type transport system involved in multi-copper enzyme maturation permease subunit
MTHAQSIRLVATFDLLESLRSRKAIVLLSLYALGALGASGLFIRLLTSIQAQFTEQFGQAVDMKMIMESPGMARLVGELAGDPEVATAIVAVPPMALFYSWLATTFVPLLVLFTSSDAVSGDVASGAVRYSLFRVDRISWAVGKLIGQTSLMAVGVLLGALVCWLTGLIWLDGMPSAETGYWLLRIAGRSTVYCFAYLGIAMCASQLARTNARAGGLALVMMFFASLLGGLTKAEPIKKSSPEMFGALAKLFPNGHELSLWHPSWLYSGTAMLGLVCIGLAWFALGFWRFSTRDA